MPIQALIGTRQDPRVPAVCLPTGAHCHGARRSRTPTPQMKSGVLVRPLGNGTIPALYNTGRYQVVVMPVGQASTRLDECSDRRDSFGGPSRYRDYSAPMRDLPDDPPWLTKEAPTMPVWDPASRLHGELLRVLHEYRAAGWFKQYAGQPDDVVAQALRARWWQDDWEEFDADRVGYGNFALLDTERVVGLDPEADTAPGNDVYIQVLDDLAGITAGALALSEAAEDWDSEPGRVIVTFVANGAPHRLRLHQFDDWVDPKLIPLLNDIVPRHQGRFYCLDTGGQMYPITFATAEEVKALNAFGRVSVVDHAPEGWPGIREP